MHTRKQILKCKTNKKINDKEEELMYSAFYYLYVYITEKKKLYIQI